MADRIPVTNDAEGLTCDTQFTTAKVFRMHLQRGVLDVFPKSKLPLYIPSYPQSYVVSFQKVQISQLQSKKGEVNTKFHLRHPKFKF